MIKKKDRQRMRDYLISKLELSYPKLELMNKEILNGIESNYIFVEPSQTEVVFLIDREYPKNSFNTIYKIFHGRGVEIAPVFFKDGSTFFRNAAEKNYFKKEENLSLKNYTNNDLQKMILFRPEERFVNSMQKYLQYYQPESSKLKEGLETFEFKPVYFDYSHIPRDRFKPLNKDSERLFIWINRIHREGYLKFDKGYLKKIE